MKTVKAKFLNKYLLMSIVFFHDVLEGNFQKDYEINGKKMFFKNMDFKNYHDNFIKELEEFILETKDINLVRDYILSCLNEIVSWDGFIHEENKIIFSKDVNISFIINLKGHIENYTEKIKSLCEIDEKGHPVGLTGIFNDTLNLSLIMNYLNSTDALKTVPTWHEEYAPTNDERFNTDKMKAECNKLKSTFEKILFIHDRLNHFKQWQLRYDVELAGEALGKTYKFSPMFYPKFEELCKFEIQRLEERMEFELKYNTPVPVEVERKNNINDFPPAHFTWKDSDTDLLELVTALHRTNSIIRKNGSSMTRKDLIVFFAKIFNIEIKDPESKLTKATNRNDETPYLDKLKRAFNQYIHEKDEKEQARRKTTKMQPK